MRRSTRIAALGFGLALVGGFTPAGPEAQAQVPVRVVTAPAARPSPTYATTRPGYVVAPSNGHQNGYFQMLNGAPHAGYTRHYGYSSARRPNETYKPWLNRD